MKKILISILMLFVISCTNEDASRRALENEGMTNINIQGYSYLGCSDDDDFHTAFTATNPQGREVSGVVCCGLWKNCTVRWN